MLAQSERRVRPWYTWAILLAAIALLALAAVVGWGLFTAPAPRIAPAAATALGATQTNEAGQVTIAVTWSGAPASPVFNVVMDTHAVDLDGYDLARLAVLRVDGREVQPAGWDAPKGGHHRQGTLTFPSTAVDGSPLFATGTRSVDLVIRDVSGVAERAFRWTPAT